jgi:hypothetical protein
MVNTLLLLIDYENDVKERPIPYGFSSFENPKYPEEGYENNSFLISNNFRVWLNDDDNEMVLDLLDDIIKLVVKMLQNRLR